jgi:hypothetical protein
MRIIGLLLVVLHAQAGTPVLTRSYDNSRNGANTTETTLTPALVQSKGLVRVKSLMVTDDPRIEATPLYVPGLVVNGKPHNVVFVASMGNHVFAFDADAPQGKDLLWMSTLLGNPLNPAKDPASGPNATVVDLYGINKLWGILSTPVIDVDANQMYIVNWVATSTDGKSRALRLHHIGLSDGKEIGTGQPLTGTLTDASGKPVIDSHRKAVILEPDQKQRAALLLSPLHGPHKTLFIGITGGEVPGDPHGWMVAVDVDTFKQTAAFPTTQQGFGGGIWQGAGGPASDDQGNVYVMTGNGGFDIRKAAGDTSAGTIVNFNGTTDFAESFIKFKYQRTGQGSLKLDDWFIAFLDSTRNGQGNPDYQDQDLGSGAPILPAGTNLLMGAGKDGVLYVLDRNNLGKKIADATALKQPPFFATFNGQGLLTSPAKSMDFVLGGGPDPAQGRPRKTHHQHSSPVYWAGSTGSFLYDWGENESLRAWKVNPVSGSVTFMAKGAEIASRALAVGAGANNFGGMTGGLISLSSNGGTNGIVWTLAPVDGNANQGVVAGAARAYDATNATTRNSDGTPRLKSIWDSTISGVPFSFSKFCPPVVADGKVYIATYDGRVDVYALKP